MTCKNFSYSVSMANRVLQQQTDRYGQPAKRGRYKCCGYFAWLISSEEEPKKTSTLFIVRAHEAWEEYVNSEDYQHQNPCSDGKTPTHLPLQIELLHLLLTVAYPNKGTRLSLLLCATLLLHILQLLLPATAHQIHTRWRAEKPKRHK